MTSTMTSTMTSNVIVFFDSAQPSSSQDYQPSQLDGFKTCQVSLPIAIQRALTADDMHRIVGAVQREIDTIKEQEDEWEAHLARNRRALQDMFVQEQQKNQERMREQQKRTASQAVEEVKADTTGEDVTGEDVTGEDTTSSRKKARKETCKHGTPYSATSPCYGPTSPCYDLYGPTSPCYDPTSPSYQADPRVCPNCGTDVALYDGEDFVYLPTSPCYHPVEMKAVCGNCATTTTANDADVAEEMDAPTSPVYDVEADVVAEEKVDVVDVVTEEKAITSEEKADDEFFAPTSPSYSKITTCIGTVSRGPRKGMRCQWAVVDQATAMCAIHKKQYDNKVGREGRIQRVRKMVDRTLKIMAKKRKFDTEFRPLTLARSTSAC
jgi:hypothetical protein